MQKNTCSDATHVPTNGFTLSLERNVFFFMNVTLQRGEEEEREPESLVGAELVCAFAC